jgi:hypothetical protein
VQSNAAGVDWDVALSTMSSGSGTPIIFYEYVPSSTESGESSQWSPVSSHPPCVDPITSLRVVTWNIWFDRRDQRTRFSAVIAELRAMPCIDVICLQEVTTSFLDLIHADAAIRTDWLITDYTDENHRWEIPPSWYGNIVLVRKKWAGNIGGWVKKFPTSTMGRYALVLEISQNDKCVVLLKPLESR